MGYLVLIYVLNVMTEYVTQIFDATKYGLAKSVNVKKLSKYKPIKVNSKAIFTNSVKYDHCFCHHSPQYSNIEDLSSCDKSHMWNNTNSNRFLHMF